MKNMKGVKTSKMKKLKVYPITEEKQSVILNAAKSTGAIVLPVFNELPNHCDLTFFQEKYNKEFLLECTAVWVIGTISTRMEKVIEYAMYQGKQLYFFTLVNNKLINVKDVLSLFHDPKTPLCFIIKSYMDELSLQDKKYEIERKWLLTEIPKNMNLLEKASIEQFYLSTNPEVKIWKKENEGFLPRCFIHIKENGTLKRNKISIPISYSKYEELKSLIAENPIQKEWYLFGSSDIEIEITKVDPGSSNEFIYAEVEFDSEKDAQEFSFPLNSIEITYDPKYKMKSYWNKTRKAG